MAKAKTDLNDEIAVFLRADELDKGKVKIIYDFATTHGYYLAIKVAQRVAGADENGVMSDEALKAINELKDDEFNASFELEIKGY